MKYKQKPVMTQKVNFRDTELPFSDVKVISNIELAPDKFFLTIEKVGSLRAGNVVAITCDISISPRIYSICNGENDTNINILFDVKSDGELSPRLAKIKAGDSLWMSEPYGDFLPDPSTKMWWISTGTGIAPFYSMMKSGYHCEQFIHGASKGINFYFSSEIRNHLADSYIQCNSGLDGSGDYSGRVTQYLKECQSFPEDRKYYLCGHALMVVEVRDILIEKGVPYQNIISEIYF